MDELMDKLAEFLNGTKKDGLTDATNTVLEIVRDELFRNEPKDEDLPDLADLSVDDCDKLLEVINKEKYPKDVEVLTKVRELLQAIYICEPDNVNSIF